MQDDLCSFSIQTDNTSYFYCETKKAKEKNIIQKKETDNRSNILRTPGILLSKRDNKTKLKKLESHG